MKKSLIALAAVAASGAAFAQSSVTLFGTVDAAVTYTSGQNSISGLNNSGTSSAALGFRGVEDLGNGLKAEFWLESGLGNDNGTAVGGKEAGNTNTSLEFKRRSSISLHSGAGELRLGRFLTAAYQAASGFDPFGTVGVGASRLWSQGGYEVRQNNMVGYYSPSFGGLKFALNYGFGETAASAQNSSYFGGSVTYANGPLSLGLGAERFNADNNASTTAPYNSTLNTDKVNAYSVGGAYDFGVVKLSAAYLTQTNKDVTTLAEEDRDQYLLALTAPVGAAGLLKLSYNHYELATVGNAKDKADQFAIGYVHSLSKRTAVYGTYAHMKNKAQNANNFALGSMLTGTGFDNGKQQGVQIGVRHNF